MSKQEIQLVDMHNHILYGVDDGANDLKDSLEMLRIAYEDGIRTVLLTPHFHPRRGMAPAEAVYEHFDILQSKVETVFPDMDLYLGREVYFSTDSLDMLEEHEELRINGGGNVLIEFSTSTPESVVRHAVRDVIMSGFTPIVAHVERYACTLENKHLIEDLKEQGAYIQVNADSVLGDNGFTVHRVVKWLLKNELVDLVATDAHDTKDRKPQLSKCYHYVSKKFGVEYADYLMCEMPLRILEEE